MNGCTSVSPAKEVDVCIYGGTAAGVIAAYSAKMMGKSAVLIEPGKYLGGLTTGGLGSTDIGNKYAVTGLSRDFYRRVGKHYGNFENWTFEPSVAGKVMHQYVNEAQLDVMYQKRIVSASKNGASIAYITLEDAQSPRTEPKIRIKAKQYIDCTYEGDLMARAGVSYTVGRENNSRYNETLNGVYLAEYRKQSGYHQFPDGVDPYKVPGDPNSGLLWGISANTLQSSGSGDDLVQAYNFRICLSNVPGNMISITRPDNYDPQRYELLARLFEAQPEEWDISQYFIWSRMPNNKTDINNRGAFSTDMIDASHNYPEAGYDEREKIFQEHVDYTKGLLYFYRTDPRVPKHLRDFVSEWGYAKDEYIDNDHWTPQLYVREARRMTGCYVMTEAHCTGREVVTDDIGMAAYGMDSHNCQRIVIHKDGKAMVKNEGNVEVGVARPYPVSYRALLPKETECNNLLVPVCLSASHIAFGSIRMEPVFMVLGQSAAIAACLAIDSNAGLHAVDVALLKEILKTNPLLDGSTPEILVDDTDAGQVENRGNWQLSKGDHYKTGYMFCDQAQKGTFFRFLPQINVTGKYRVYYYCPRAVDVPVKIAIDIRSASGMDEVTFDPREDAGNWKDLGVYKFTREQAASITLNGEKSTGPLFADAVLLVKE
ncbi:MAG: FAD-dependent oxidoreductase [Bacteroidales bacterium]|nr:FAD-dependent oxidoreductase [Bacteroidales bacterium]